MISSFGRGVQVVKEYWEKKGLDVFPLRMNDGSGLAPADKVSAGFMGELLVYMATESAVSDAFIASLPQRGHYGCQELCRLYHERWKDVCGSRFLE